MSSDYRDVISLRGTYAVRGGHQISAISRRMFLVITDTSASNLRRNLILRFDKNLPRMKQTARKNSSSALMNFGSKTILWLEAIGIQTLGQLRTVGSVGAYRALKGMGYPATANFLYAAEGALRGMKWDKLPKEIRIELLLEAGIRIPQPHNRKHSR